MTSNFPSETQIFPLNYIYVNMYTEINVAVNEYIKMEENILYCQVPSG